MSKPSSRITLEPAFVLHRYDWSESSLVIEVFTQHYGRVTLVAKGAKRPASNFRPVLLPMQPLRITYSGEAQVKALKSAEWVGGYAMPSGAMLLSGFYINELLMRLLHHEEPHEMLFDHYAQVLSVLAQGSHLASAALRAFELVLLQSMGWLPSLSTQTQTQKDLQAERRYTLVAEQGLCDCEASDLNSLRGYQWVWLAQHLERPLSKQSFLELLALLVRESQITLALRSQLRSLLNHCSGAPLKTPQIMVALQQL